jgi:exodeoxyribonuclease VII large subunit
MGKKERIDTLLVQKGFFDSRERAKRSIMAGIVFVDNQKVDKPGTSVNKGASISLYERSGQYQLYVRDMEPAGIGALYIAYLQLKERLEKEGIFDAKYKKQLPYIPKKIAVITSPTGAAVRDIISIILRRFPKVELYVFPVSVQGETAAPSIVDAIDMCNSFSDIDVAIVGRGGGSMEELWAFNEEEVARAIFRSSVPIVSAVGHETDFTIASASNPVVRIPHQ